MPPFKRGRKRGDLRACVPAFRRGRLLSRACVLRGAGGSSRETTKSGRGIWRGYCRRYATLAAAPCRRRPSLWFPCCCRWPLVCARRPRLPSARVVGRRAVLVLPFSFPLEGRLKCALRGAAFFMSPPDAVTSDLVEILVRSRSPGSWSNLVVLDPGQIS